jgi:hypothetical protein
LCFKEVFPPQLRTMDEEDKITQQRKLDIELNPNLKSIQFLFKVGGIVLGIACCPALRLTPVFLTCVRSTSRTIGGTRFSNACGVSC